MTKDEAMQMALDALLSTGLQWPDIMKAIEALRTALANHCERCGKKLGTEVTDIHTCTPKEMQPVAWKMKGVPAFATSRPSDTDSIKWEALYAAPQKKEWVGLTDDEIDEALGVYNSFGGRLDARKIEAKLKEKND